MPASSAISANAASPTRPTTAEFSFAFVPATSRPWRSEICISRAASRRSFSAIHLSLTASTALNPTSRSPLTVSRSRRSFSAADRSAAATCPRNAAISPASRPFSRPRSSSSRDAVDLTPRSSSCRRRVASKTRRSISRLSTRASQPLTVLSISRRSASRTFAPYWRRRATPAQSAS